MFHEIYPMFHAERDRRDQRPEADLHHGQVAGQPRPEAILYRENAASVLVDSAGRIDPKLLASDDSVELTFTADNTYWSIESKSCTPQDGLPSKDWLFCAVNDDKSGFVIETRLASAPVLYFGMLRQGVDSAAYARVLIVYQFYVLFFRMAQFSGHFC